MADIPVTLLDGRKVNVNIPDGLSQEEQASAIKYAIHSDLLKRASVEAEQQRVQQNPSLPAARQLGQGAIDLVGGVVGLPRAAADVVGWGAMKAGAMSPETLKQRREKEPLPSAEDASAWIRRNIGVENVPPTTGMERLARDIGGTLPMMAYPPVGIPAVGGAALGWGLGEVGRAFMPNNPEVAEGARLAGNLFGAGVIGGARATTPNASRMLQRRLGQYTPDELAAAERLQTEAQGIGVPLMAHEAIDRTPGGPMARLAGDTAAQAYGRAVPRFIQQRQDELAGRLETEISKIGPKVPDMSEAARRVADAAENVVLDPKNARVAAAKPFFEKAEVMPLPPDVRRNVLRNVATELFHQNPEATGAKLIDDFRRKWAAAETYGQAKQALDEFETIVRSGAFEGQAVDKTVRARMKPILDDALNRMLATNDDFRRGMSFYSELAPETVAVKAAEGGPSARIAAAQTSPEKEGGAKTFAAWLQGEQSTDRVKTEIARLNAKDPIAAREALRLMLQRAVDDAFTKTGTGEPVNAGVKFMQGVAETPQKKANVVAAVEGVTGNKTLAVGFDRFFDILGRTGVTPAFGSPTATRGSTMAEAGQGGIVNAVGDVANIAKGSFIAPLRDINERLRGAHAFEEIGNLLVQPDSVAKIRKLALMDPKSAKASALVAEILAGQRGANP